LASRPFVLWILDISRICAPFLYPVPLCPHSTEVVCLLDLRPALRAFEKQLRSAFRAELLVSLVIEPASRAFHPSTFPQRLGRPVGRLLLGGVLYFRKTEQGCQGFLLPHLLLQRNHQGVVNSLRQVVGFDDRVVVTTPIAFNDKSVPPIQRLSSLEFPRGH